MKTEPVHYSIVQYSPHPERFEYLNVGLILFRGHSFSQWKITDDLKRVRRLFPDLNSSFFKSAAHDFVSRVEYEGTRLKSAEGLSGVDALRRGSFRITPVMPFFQEGEKDGFHELFQELVGEIRPQRYRQRVDRALADALKNQGVLPLLDSRPSIVRIEKYGVNLKAQFGYQNGVYNLIDSARFDDAEVGLAEAGKRVLEGRALSETLSHRLIVVGEFGDQPRTYVDAIRDDLERAGTKLYRLDDVASLAREIRNTAH